MAATVMFFTTDHPFTAMNHDTKRGFMFEYF